MFKKNKKSDQVSHIEDIRRQEEDDGLDELIKQIEYLEELERLNIIKRKNSFLDRFPANMLVCKL